MKPKPCQAEELCHDTRGSHEPPFMHGSQASSLVGLGSLVSACAAGAPDKTNMGTNALSLLQPDEICKRSGVERH